MHVFVVYAHPGQDSFCRQVRDRFLQALAEAGHSYTLSDLYAMGFATDMSEAEYDRESNYRRDLPVSEDVLAEQAKINAADAIVFIYPVFWTDAPAKLKGWFDRVWTFGFAYGEDRAMKTLKKAVVIANTGNTMQHLEEYGYAEAMRRVMLGDRMFDRVVEKQMVFLDGTSKDTPELRKANWERHLATVEGIAKNL